MEIVSGLASGLLLLSYPDAPPHDSVLAAVQREANTFMNYVGLDGRVSIQDYELLCPMTVTSNVFSSGPRTEYYHVIRARIRYYTSSRTTPDALAVDISQFYSNELLFGLSRVDVEQMLATTRAQQRQAPEFDRPMGYEWRASIIPNIGMDCSQSEITIERDDMAQMRMRLLEILDAG